jgi:hypothetical protein
MDAAIDAVLEIFTWVGFGAGALLAGVALVAYLLDGTWLPARAAVESTERGRVVRWFDENDDVNEAWLDAQQEHAIGAVEWADIFVRRGSRDRMRLSRRSPFVWAVTLLALGLIAVGVIAVACSLVLLFVRG